MRSRGGLAGVLCMAWFPLAMAQHAGHAAQADDAEARRQRAWDTRLAEASPISVGAALDSLGRWAAIVGSAFAMGDAIGPIVFGFTNDLGGTGSLIGLVVISSIAVALLLGPATLTLDRRRKAGRSPGDPADVGADALGP